MQQRLEDQTSRSSGISSTRKSTREEVAQAISLIYSSYRDDARLTDDFMLMVKSALLDCNVEELEALCSPTQGLASLHTFPPGLAEIANFRKKWRAHWQILSRPTPKLTPFSYQRTKFRPFPRLWEAFADEPKIIAILDNAPLFAFLEDASRTLARWGKDRARAYIDPPPMPVDQPLPVTPEPDDYGQPEERPFGFGAQP